ncbi:MAG: hypothetical protein N2Z74_08630, partial [Syntrophales bacterium]|nr:hypothetical protein [Syntrophales bacterium]
MKNKILEVLQIFNAAITNMRLYPPTSAMVVNTIERLFQAIDAVLASGTAIVIAEVEKHLLVGEEPLTIKEMERPQVAAFLELLINFGIQSITIIPGLERKELLSFIEVMVQKPEVVKDAGGFTQVMADRKISHIILDQKVYIAKDGDNKLFAGLEIRDDDEFINYLIQADPRLDISMDNLRQMAKNTTWLERIFRNGMSQIMAKKGQLPNSHLMGNLMRMIGTLDGMTDKKDQDYISRLIAESITELDAEMIGIVLSQDMDRYFNGKIVEHVHDQVDEEKLERVMEHLGRITAGPSLPGGVTDSL